MKRHSVLLVMAAVAGAMAARSEEVPVRLAPKIVSVSVFKNGLGYVVREGELPRGEQPVLIGELAAPVHGTFWVTSPAEGATIKELVGFEQESTQTVAAVSVAEVLEANVGRTVELRIGEKETLRGTLVAVPSSRPTELTRPVGARTWSGHWPYAAPGESAALIVLRTAAGTVALNKAAIQQVSVEGGELQTSIQRVKRAAALQLRASNPTGKGRVRVQYLAKGMTWAPSCDIDITDPKTARLMAKAELINEIEDLDQVTVHFITGFPNLKFADVIDPMAMRGDLASFLNDLVNPPQPGRYRDHRGVVTQQGIYPGGALGPEEMFTLFPAPGYEAQAREELFFYEYKPVTLRKGERGYYPLYTVQVPYEHVYEWKIGDTLQQPAAEIKPEEVWHSVRLTNTGAIPWTTAPATVTQRDEILGQDVLYYASAGGKTSVRITQAMDIHAEQTEYETDRKRNAANFGGWSHDLVEVRGVLRAANYKNKDITLTITKMLTGEVLSSSPQAKVEVIARGLKHPNPNCVLSWELPVKARDKIEIEYSYRLYVRS
jgi:hypothetical protein